MNKLLKIEVCYAGADRQQIMALEVAEGSTLEAAIVASTILTLFPEINLSKQKIGIFSKARHLDDIVEEGDRIEIYRPLVMDPKEIRRAKAKRSVK